MRSEAKTPSKQWYVLRVQSGREELVKKALEKQVKTAGLTSEVGRVLVPTESISEIKGGKKTVSQRKIYPGYLMVEMEMSEQAWYVIRETPGIGDFLGSNARPVPMRLHEVEKILGEAASKAAKPKLKIGCTVGDSVKIKEGPFENFDGVVEEVIPSKGLVKVVVTIFGRATPVELECWQVERI